MDDIEVRFNFPLSKSRVMLGFSNFSFRLSRQGLLGVFRRAGKVQCANGFGSGRTIEMPPIVRWSTSPKVFV